MSMHTRVALVLTTISLVATAASGCSSTTTQNGASSGTSGGTSGTSGGTSGASGGTSGSSGGGVESIAEKEPNNGPDMAGMQSIGTFGAARSVKITGHLDSGGFDGTKYTGDFDGFVFEVTTAGTMANTIDWTGTADVDAGLYNASLQQITGDGTTVKPISSTGQIPVGKYALVLYSKDQPADWTITLSFTTGSSASSSGTSGTSGTSGGGGCVDQAVLSDGYWQKTRGGLEEIRFNQDGTIDDGYALPPSGTIWSKGTYTYACPAFQATIDSKPYTFQMNGTSLSDQNGYKWVKCTPISSGECF